MFHEYVYALGLRLCFECVFTFCMWVPSRNPRFRERLPYVYTSDVCVYMVLISVFVLYVFISCVCLNDTLAEQGNNQSDVWSSKFELEL
jgi:hypothetical protein